MPAHFVLWQCSLHFMYPLYIYLTPTHVTDLNEGTASMQQRANDEIRKQPESKSQDTLLPIGEAPSASVIYRRDFIIRQHFNYSSTDTVREANRDHTYQYQPSPDIAEDVPSLCSSCRAI